MERKPFETWEGEIETAELFVKKGGTVREFFAKYHSRELFEKFLTVYISKRFQDGHAQAAIVTDEKLLAKQVTPFFEFYTNHPGLFKPEKRA